MFGSGVRLNQVFASRWKALLWSAGVLMTAYCTVPSADDSKDQANQPATQLQDLQNIPQIPPPDK